MSMELTDQQWTAALNLVHTSSICTRHGLIQCKLMYRIHYTNAKLARIYPTVSDACNRCNQSPANHFHMFWSCPKLTNFWQNIFDTLGGAYGKTIPPTQYQPFLAPPLTLASLP